MIHSAGTTETDDLFGFALAVADFDRDGFADAAFGHPGEFQLVPQDGGVTVIVGSASGLTAGRRHGPGGEPVQHEATVTIARDEALRIARRKGES